MPAKNPLWGWPAPKQPAPVPQTAPKRPMASPKADSQGGSSTPEPKKPVQDVLKASRTDTDYALLGVGIPPRHPNTGQHLIATGPGRAPRLLHKAGEVTGKPLWRYEGSECWHSNRASALHAWMAVFGTFYPKEAKMLVAEYNATPEEEDLLA